MLKLPTHNRYDYSSIEKRPDFDWPGGKRLAFYVALNVEQFAFLAGRGADPTQRGGPQTQRNYAWRDYGLRVGIWRIFRMLDELQLPATILLNSLICDTVPDIVEWIKRRGDDVCAHGRSNAEALGGLWEHDEATVIAEATETLTRHFGQRPTGWMGPGAAESRVTSDLIKEAGYTTQSGLAARRPADLDADARRSDIVGSLSDGAQRHRHQCLSRSHRPRIRGHDRGAVRRTGGAIGRATAGHVGIPPHLHHRATVPAAASAASSATLRRTQAQGSGLVYAGSRHRQLLLYAAAGHDRRR